MPETKKIELIEAAHLKESIYQNSKQVVPIEGIIANVDDYNKDIYLLGKKSGRRWTGWVNRYKLIIKGVKANDLNIANTSSYIIR
jgi:hypothetical protein